MEKIYIISENAIYVDQSENLSLVLIKPNEIEYLNTSENDIIIIDFAILENNIAKRVNMQNGYKVLAGNFSDNNLLELCDKNGFDAVIIKPFYKKEIDRLKENRFE